MEKKYDLGNIIQPNVELHQAEEEKPNGLVVGNDPKTAFLTELKELLIKYNVEIDAYGDNYGDFGIGFNFADDSIWYTNDWSERTNFQFPITPSNIFDYDK